MKISAQLGRLLHLVLLNPQELKTIWKFYILFLLWAVLGIGLSLWGLFDIDNSNYILCNSDMPSLMSIMIGTLMMCYSIIKLRLMVYNHSYFIHE